MKITRSTKCSVKFATRKKKEQLKTILKEYGKVVNIFINYFWTNPTIDKAQLLKPIIDIPKDTWLSARLRKVAAREALDMIGSVKEVFNWNKEQLQTSINAIENKIEEIKQKNNTRENRRKVNNLYKKLKSKKNRLSMVQITKPNHKGDRMSISSTIGELQKPKKETKEFDAWLHLSSIGNNILLNIPIKFHKHYLELQQKSTRLNSYIVTLDYVQFAFERETGPKKQVKDIISIDTGINALASTIKTKTKETISTDNVSKGTQYGTNIKELIKKIKRCKKGSKGKQRAINTLKQCIDKIAKDLVNSTDLIVVEKLSNLNNNSKLKGRLSKNVRSSIGSWNYAYWLMRIEGACEESRTSFRTVSPHNTSRKCPVCGHTCSENRNGEVFKCQACGYTGNADLVAALNILVRFFTGSYGSCYKPKNLQEFIKI